MAARRAILKSAKSEIAVVWPLLNTEGSALVGPFAFSDLRLEGPLPTAYPVSATVSLSQRQTLLPNAASCAARPYFMAEP